MLVCGSLVVTWWVGMWCRGPVVRVWPVVGVALFLVVAGGVVLSRC